MAAKKVKTKNSKTKQSTKVNKEISAEPKSVKFKWVSASLLFAFFTALFLFFTTEPKLSSIINHFLYGLCGKVAVTLPISAIGLSVYVVKTKVQDHIKSKYIITALIVLFLSVFVHLCSSSVEDPINSYTLAYETFLHSQGGGFFGALIAYPLYNAIGRGATIAIVILIQLVLISLLINKSLFTLFVGMIRGTFGVLTDEGRKVDHGKDFKYGAQIATKKIGRIKNKGFDYVDDNRTDAERGQDIISVAKGFADNTPQPKNSSRRGNKPKAEDVFSKDVLDSFDQTGIEDVFAGIIDKKEEFRDEVNDAIASVNQSDDPHSPTLAAREFARDNSNTNNEFKSKEISDKTNSTTMPQSPSVNRTVDDTDSVSRKEQANKREASLTQSEVDQMSAEIAEREEEPIREYIHPTTNLLRRPNKAKADQRKAMYETSKQLIQVLDDFGVRAKLLEVTQGPTVTRYEIQPSTGTKLAKIQNLAEDLALNLAVQTVLVSPVAGKAAVGIEIPNREVNAVSGRELFESSEFQNSSSKLTFALGKDIGGKVIVGDLAKMPHVLIAGATGSGKSVCVNTIITSILYNASPEEVKLIMIDPKVVELGVYNGIPHLLIPVVTDPKRAAGALNWAVSEMMHRYDLFATNSVRNIEGYNELMEKQKMRKMNKIVIIIDELADLMMVAAKEVEDYICRLTQLARAAGIHLIVATQRPSVDVVTGLIKANIPSRIAFAVSSQVDSRTIIDRAGAEKLLGKGDMLYYPASARTPMRVQGAFISDNEIENVINFIKENNPVTTHYSEDLQDHIDRVSTGENGVTNDKVEGDEPLLVDAITIAAEAGQISTSMIQRKLSVGYARAGRIIDKMEERGIIGPANGSKPRQVYVSPQEARNMFNESVNTASTEAQEEL